MLRRLRKTVARFVRNVRGSGNASPRAVHERTDEEWLELLVRSVHEPVIDGIRFPRFPAPEIQSRFVGSEYEHALREAFNFYSMLKQSSAELGVQLGKDTKVLDFGCGWGRFLRFFAKDITPENLFGCDVLPFILDVCRETGVPGRLSAIEPLGRLPYDDASFDVIMAFSVFTHLPAHVHEHWAREFKRVAKPGCVVVFTVEPRRFIDFLVSIPEDAPSAWHRGMREFAKESPRLYEEHDRGDVAYIATGGGDGLDSSTYGDAVVPRAYLERVWAPEFGVHDYIDDANRFWQAVAIIKKH